ncbi:hypothetical protein ACS0TY_003998 [Phlomoides rotata]
MWNDILSSGTTNDEDYGDVEATHKAEAEAEEESDSDEEYVEEEEVVKGEANEVEPQLPQGEVPQEVHGSESSSGDDTDDEYHDLNSVKRSSIKGGRLRLFQLDRGVHVLPQRILLRRIWNIWILLSMVPELLPYCRLGQTKHQLTWPRISQEHDPAGLRPRPSLSNSVSVEKFLN